jgi:hypothetical protein
MKLDGIFVSKNAFNSDDLYDIVYSNICVVNLLKEEGVKEGDICEEALISYYVDYYLAEYNNGNFSQFVYNSGWKAELNERIAKGLELIGAKENLKTFQTQSAKVDRTPKTELEAFFASEYFGNNAIRDSLDDDSFFDLDEDIVLLNSKWLKTHKKLRVLPIDDIYSELEKFIGRKIER